MEDFISRGVSGIVLAPLDDIALRGPVANAKAAGIPVVIIDSDLKSDDYTSFAATDNYLGGKIGGQELIRLLNGKGRVIMLRGQEGSASTTNREQGFLDTIATAPGITVVSSNQYGGATVETAYRASENLLAPLTQCIRQPHDRRHLHPERIHHVRHAARVAGRRSCRPGHFVGFDSSTKLVEALRNRQLNALVLQNPCAMGYLGVKTARRPSPGRKGGEAH